MAEVSSAGIDATRQRIGSSAPAWLPNHERGTAALLSSRDWSETPLGPLEGWPEPLVRAVQLCLDSSFPFALAWGKEEVQLYNDAFVAICGGKHPQALGQRFRDCWASAWPVLGPHFEQAARGNGSYVEDGRLFLDRSGSLEEAFLTFSFSPLRGPSDGEVCGVLLTVIETTGKVLAERRTRLLRDVVTAGAGAASTGEALTSCISAVADAPYDVPFAVAYALDADGKEAEMVATTLTTLAASGPPHIAFNGSGSGPGWSAAIADVAVTGRHRVLSLEPEWRLVAGPYAQPPTTALLLPLALPGALGPRAVLVAACSPRLSLDGEYVAFFERLAGAFATSMSGARAHEEQRKRAEQLSALDRAKTVFFSNVSHELRTPLTLLAGPLEDELAEREPLPEPRRERLATAHRNAQRLIKLVNVLLDFSRIEAGRALARYRPTPLGTLTSELISMFRSALERAGLTLDVEIEPHSELVFVDREMWEKIVLNLMSNAFKHTFAGGVRVGLHYTASAVELTIADTGIGIDERELPHLFERFHRVVGAQSRTHEGTGIGLALVRELSRLHGGDVSVTSQRGQGTTFKVTVPLGSRHLPREHIDSDATEMPAGTDIAAYVQEASQWSRSEVELTEPPAPSREDRRSVHAPAKILLADDNADMRAYISGLLKSHYQVAAVADGMAALELLPTFKPDLVLTDVMMPRLDGAGLLRALRAGADTRRLPVILVSARAGEEAATEGIEAGADDYLVKPFSARELLARVRTHVELARARREWADHLERANQELEAFSYSVSHDLRTPLRAIDGFSKAILTRKSDQLDDEGKQYLFRVRRAAGRMSELIDELLNLSRVSRAPLHRQALSFTALAKQVARGLAETEPLRAVAFEADPDVGAYADPRLLRIALENLLHNSWKFTSRRLDAKVRVGQVAGASPPIYFVMDNGAGFDPTYAHRLFQPFQRLHAEPDYPGTGVGLAIVHRIVSRHGGRIWAEGHEGQGATFYFTLSGNS